MIRFYCFTVICLLIATWSASAQKATTEKALAGCWKIVDFSITPTPKNMDQIKKDAINGTICFDNGRFTGKRADGSSAGTGTYTISEDGKTLSQKVDNQPDHTDNPDAKIITLNDTEFAIQAEEATMRFVLTTP